MFNGRLHAAVVAALFSGLFVLWLAPESVLALPLKCGLKLLTGLNCPLCGITRDMAAMASGHAASHNPASPVVAALLFGAYPLGVAACLVFKRNLPVSPELVSRILPAALLLMFVANNWGN